MANGMSAFPKKDGDRFIGNMGDEMILMGGTFYLYKLFDADKQRKAEKKDFEKQRRSKEYSRSESE